MRKRLAALLCTAALLGALTAALAAPAPSAMEVRTWQGEIWVNGVQVRFQNEKGEEVPLFSCGGTVYIPLHTAGEWLGCTVRWSREDRTVALTGGGTPCYRNGPGNAAAHASGVAAEICPDIAVTLNGVPVEFSDGNGDPVYPAVLGESVYLPARGVGALCGLSAAWRPDSAVHPGGAVYLRDGSAVPWRRPGFAADRVEYPVTPADRAAWGRLTSQAAKVEALTLPQQTLEAMSPEGLTATALEYPLFANIVAFNTRWQGFDRVAGESNVLKAVLERAEETAPVVKDLIVGLDLDDLYRTDDAAFLRLIYLATLAARDEMLAPLDDGERAELLQAAGRLAGEIEKDWSGSYLNIELYRLAGRILLADDAAFRARAAEDPALTAFLDGEDHAFTESHQAAIAAACRKAAE